jgi:7,8-dihydro-6-hydroxymethylpterin-pyrophosphokinase
MSVASFDCVTSATDSYIYVDEFYAIRRLTCSLFFSTSRATDQDISECFNVLCAGKPNMAPKDILFALRSLGERFVRRRRWQRAMRLVLHADVWIVCAEKNPTAKEAKEIETKYK